MPSVTIHIKAGEETRLSHVVEDLVRNDRIRRYFELLRPHIGSEEAMVLIGLAEHLSPERVSQIQYPRKSKKGKL